MEALPKNNYYSSSGLDPQEDALKRISYGKEPRRVPRSIALIVPPSPQVPTPGREFLVTGPFEGFTYMATLVRKMGYNLKVIDCRLKDDPEKLVLDGVKDADIVGIAAYCDSFVFLRNITRLIKREYAGKMIFLGGPLVTSLPEIILKNTSADCAILGEAELTTIELLNTYFSQEKNNFTGIKGMACKQNGGIKINPPRPQIKDLDNLPFLDYTIWPNYESIVKNGQILISSMRGCPQECSFCFKTIPRLRLKSLERFEEEVAYLKKATRFDYAWLNDLTFNVIEERAIKICGILKKYNVRYHCFARVQNIGAELAAALKGSGCLGIWFGIESCDQEVLDLNRKNITVGDINKGIQTAEDAGLAVRGLFIVGLYGETEGSLKKMVSFIRQGRFLPLVKYLVPFPGTSLYQYALNSGKIKDITAFLEMLSGRKVSDHDDEIVNLTGLDEDILRDHFHQIWDITKERELCLEQGQ
ncbi:MAG: radical SAM protein [Candidatus Omnitrophica bacterium]|nr:radical SAM protein [Candidatus Omnitrophota bacterium]MDD5553461.1 radical SAM protein [Candidatus Omnitrophota bacterium]